LPEGGAIILAHVGLIAERHRPALHRLRIDNDSMFLEIGDRFQNYLFWRFAEAFVRRIA